MRSMMKGAMWAWGGLGFALLTACGTPPEKAEWVDEEANWGDPTGLTDEAYLGRTKADGGSNGDGDYCNDPTATCDAGEGDCDSDAQCTGSLVCGVNNGALFGQPANFDVCWPTHCENGVQDGDETGIDYGGSCSLYSTCPPPGVQNSDSSAYCTVECPCLGGFGDCDRDTHCDVGFVCGTNNGYLWGMPTFHDVCWPATCENGIQDGDETDVDYGGSCGATDQCLLALWFPDTDGDGYGSGTPFTDCDGVTPSGFVKNNEDCDDTDNTQNPDAVEVCNGEDDDCNGVADDGADGAVRWYADGDGDSYGNPLTSTVACFTPSGYVGDNTDCNDSNGSVNPGAAEVCGNGLDDNCDGISVACAPSGSLDASTDAWARLTGATDDGLGYAIVGGDFDNDGEGDLLIGGPVIPWRSTPVHPGHAYVLYGPIGTGTSAISAAADATFVGEADFEHAGTSVAAGDLDADGADDMLIGAPRASDGTDGGRTYLNYGGARFSGTVGLGGSDAVFTGGAAQSWAGHSADAGRNVASTASYPDMIIGLPGDLESASGLNGAAYVLRGQATRRSGVQTTAAASHATFGGGSMDSGHGNSVALVGNVGGTATGDVAVGAPGLYWWPVSGDAYPGDAYVFFGPVVGNRSIATAEVSVSGDDNDDWVGVFVGGADLDGDGISELMVSASGDSSVATEAGKLGLFRGPLLAGGLSISDAEITIRGDASYTYVGESATVGDFDNDGNSDLVVGVYDVGAYLWYGPVTDGDFSVTTADLLIDSSAASEVNIGFPVAFIGDVTGDGLEDLAVGDIGDSASAGAVYILAGLSL